MKRWSTESVTWASITVIFAVFAIFVLVDVLS
ncbi:hypothetical protein FDH86_gp005 [Arthrobacter phage Tank]|uniref:Uncharacterized protein n=2 Tax=Tankvirus tank TaxID=1982567 RepID=A0A0U4K3E6_9CAUD|nr:hypothetical protein FDH86_gp005 [Arthrobacter phage Tank]ALY10540.1 hypothetical protein TANK_5 [Arthrobacter phage Tank]ALY10794.1 hypothetical protein WILDE_5 [Arthrobacter phage Wilde]